MLVDIQVLWLQNKAQIITPPPLCLTTLYEEVVLICAHKNARISALIEAVALLERSVNRVYGFS